MSGQAGPEQPPGPATAGPSDLRRLRSQLLVMGGLLLTFGGLVGYGLLLPTAPELLDAVIPWLAVGFLTAWSGGIFLGNSRNAPPPTIRPALRAQAAIGVLATVAGVLSAIVVVQKLTPGAAVSTGPLSVLEVAVLGVALTWAGGSLMGAGMRRFVRRRRSPHL